MSDTTYATDEYNDTNEDDDDERVTWAQFRHEIRTTYSPGETIDGAAQIVQDIERVDLELYAKKGLEALANRGVLGDEGDQFRVLKQTPE